MRRITGAVAMALLLGWAAGAQAQSRLSLELRGGFALPAESFGASDLDTGFGFEVTARYRFLPHLAVYGGWDWYHFMIDGAARDEDVDVEETGYAVGLIFQHPLTASLDGWLRAGALFNHIEIEDAGEITFDTDHELGFEVGAGLAVPVSQRIMLTPGARYRSVSHDLELGEFAAAATLSYFALELGASFSF